MNMLRNTQAVPEPTRGSQSGRAKFACLSCRTKKIRCDSARGTPCGNCKFYMESCVVVPRRAKWLVACFCLLAHVSLIRNWPRQDILDNHPESKRKVSWAPAICSGNNAVQRCPDTPTRQRWAFSQRSSYGEAHNRLSSIEDLGPTSWHPTASTSPESIETNSPVESVNNVRDWAYMLEARDENGIPAIMGFVDHLRHPNGG